MTARKPPLSYPYAVTQEQACELFAKLVPLCADYTLAEVVAASCEITCRTLVATARHSPSEARVLRDALIETLQELEL